MALTLGSPNLPGNAQYVHRTGRILLLCLLPYFALGIGDGFFLAELVRHPPQFWLYDVTKFVFIPAAYLLVFHRYFHIHASAYLYTDRAVDYQGWEWLGVTFLSVVILDVIYFMAYPVAAVLLIAPIALVRWFLSLWLDLPAYGAIFDYSLALPDDRLLRAVVAIFFSITAGVVEEIFFRGLLRQAISALFGARAVKTYIISSALIFGLAHWEQGPIGLTNATAFGLCAAWLYLKLGDLRPVILAHTLIDLYFYW